MPSKSKVLNTEEHGRHKTDDKILKESSVTPERDDFGLPIRTLTSTLQQDLGPASEGESRKKEITQSQLKECNTQNVPTTSAKDVSRPPLDSSRELAHERGDKEFNATQSTQDSKAITEQQPSDVTPNNPGDSETSNDRITGAANSSSITTDPQEEIYKPNDTKIQAPPVELKDVIKGQGESAPVEGHRRGQSSTGAGISEWSHQQLAPKDAVEEEVEEDQWQVMPAYAPYDIYDDNNKLVAREANESDEEADNGGLGGAGKGYTRVQLDEDAQSATSLDENTQYLFKDVNGTSAAGPDDDEARDALSQMQATKELLTEGQRIAYVGMTRLTLSDMLKQCEAMLNKSKGSKKEAGFAAEAMKMWGQKMMVRLYSHMDISSAEQVMIEQLAEHGVESKDLTPTLMQNSRVKNPMAEMNEKDTHLTAMSPMQASTSSIKRHSQDSITSIREEEESASPPPPYVQHEGDDLPEVRTPSQLPTSKNIDIDLRWTVLCDLFLTLIADSIYDARSRVLLERVGQHMDVSWTEICRFEKRVTDALEMQQAAEKENWNEEEHKEARRKQALKKRYVYMGLATVGGGLVIGLSAGLLAPVIGAGLAAGFTTIGVAGTSGFLAGAGGAAIITSTAAASGGVIAVRAANRRTGAVKTFEYRPLHNNKRVNLIVTVSGWMTGKVDDVRLPYSTVDPIMGDIYSVLWEPEMLTSMGDTINILATEALTQGLQQVLGSTILVGLMAALQLPVVLTKLSYLIDNPWTVSLDRANAAGLILADSLLARNLGTRPITLVGYSLGSRMIFSCLKELAKKGAIGIVQNVYLFGSPIVANRDEYLKARSVVAGRFVNGYAKNDWILGYLFRLTSGGISRIAGLAPVEDIPELENIDVTSLVPGHMSYRTAMPRLLQEVGFIVESLEFTEIEDPDPENHAKRQRELINEIEEARKELEEKEKAKGIKGAFGIFGRKRKAGLKKKEWETYQESKEEHNEKTDEAYESNSTVFFDIEAIRRELASEHMEVKELPSTLPPITLGEQVEVRELKSTLPPMKLDITSPLTSPRPGLRETKTYDSSVLTPSKASIISSPAPAARFSGDVSHTIDNPSSNSSKMYLYEDNMQMTFDEAYHSPTPAHGSYNEPTTDSHFSPPIASSVDRSAAIPRPGLKSSVTMPAVGLGLEHNAWTDDDEEFKEKEMEMTFA